MRETRLNNFVNGLDNVLIELFCTTRVVDTVMDRTTIMVIFCDQ